MSFQLQANEDYRAVGKGKSDDQTYALGRLVEDLDPVEAHLTYPQNVTLQNILYFWVAPTLTYQIAFPKTDRVRWWKVMLILGRMGAVLLLGSYLIAQVVNPVLSGLLQDLEKAQGHRTGQIFLNYWLKLSIARWVVALTIGCCLSLLSSYHKAFNLQYILVASNLLWIFSPFLESNCRITEVWRPSILPRLVEFRHCKVRQLISIANSDMLRNAELALMSLFILHDL